MKKFGITTVMVLPGDFTATHGPTLPIKAHSDWFTALVTDDVDKAKQILQERGPKMKHNLLNFPFEYNNNHGELICREKSTDYHVTLPLHVAFSHGSRQVTSLLISEGAHLQDLEKGSDNILHSCAVTSFYKPDIEEDVVKTVRSFVNENIIPGSVLREMLLHENHSGLRPMEFAAQQGCLRLMAEYFNMGHHVQSETEMGLVKYRLYNVTEYETGERHAKSPLNMISELDKSKMDDPFIQKLLTNSVFASWIQNKVSSNWPFLFAWIFFRLIAVVTFFVTDANINFFYDMFGNLSSVYICPELAYVDFSISIQLGIYGFLLFGNCLYILFGIFEFVYLTRKKYRLSKFNLQGKKKPIHSHKFFETSAYAYIVIITFNVINYILFLAGKNLPTAIFGLVHFNRGLLTLLVLTYVLFFLQLVPTLAISVIQLKHMLTDIIPFLILFLIVLMPFIHTFETFSLSNATEGCIEDFSNPFLTGYTLFRMMNNMVDPRSYKVQNLGVLYANHTAYVFVVAIMLLNFLIALMSNTAKEISENKQVIVTINKLSLVMKLENRIFMAFRKFYAMTRKLSFLCHQNDVTLLSAEMSEAVKSKI